MTATRAQHDRQVLLSARSLDGVLFDMDGVLTDTAVVHRRAWAAMFDAYLRQVAARSGQEHRPFDVADYRTFVDGRQRHDGVRSFLASRGIALPEGAPGDPPSRETVWGLANRKNRAFQQLLDTSGARVFPSSVGLVRALQAAGIGTAVISASRNAQQVLDVAGVGDLFAVRVDGLEAERLALAGKPSPAMFLEAARRLGAEPARAAVVEDAVAGVAAGRAGHFALVIGVDRTGEASDLLAAGADVVVEDLGSVIVTD